jgi:long-chain-alcohol oxidase
MAWGYFPPGVESEGNCYQGGIITAMCKEDAKWDGRDYDTIIQTPVLAPGSFDTIMPWVSGADMKEQMMKYQCTAHVFALTRDKGSDNVGRDMDVHYNLMDSCRLVSTDIYASDGKLQNGSRSCDLLCRRREWKKMGS